MHPASQPEKYLGVIKWFHDHAKDANYGFIEHPKFGDLFFHEKSAAKGQEIGGFSEGKIVTFYLIPTKKKGGIKGNSLKDIPVIIKQNSDNKNPEAFNVLLLAHEYDAAFLLREICCSFFLAKEGLERIIQQGSEKRLFELVSKRDDNTVVSDLFNQFKEFVDGTAKSQIIREIKPLKRLLVFSKKYFKDNYAEIVSIIGHKANDEINFELWIDRYSDTCPINYISSFVFKSDESTKVKIFNRCTSEDRVNIFFRFIYILQNINTDFKLEVVKNYLIFAKKYAKDEYEKILTATLNICPAYFMLSLWLDEFHDILDFNAYKLYTITLSPSNQKRFVKKVLKYIHEEKAIISIEDLTSINTIDYETSKIANDIDKSKLDYSTSIVLNVLSELHRQTNVQDRKNAKEAQHRMYDLIVKQIKDPADILEITGFFDECEGRCKVTTEEIKNEKGEIVDKKTTKHRDENNKPRLHIICDGRKAVNSKTNEAAISEEGCEFWWCANSKCFEPSRRLHNSEEWENYNLLDFLTILKVPFNYLSFEIYLNLINKANRFLNHLKCRECTNILRPVKKSNYAFYGVNLFQCVKEGCSESHKHIYITHCLNGFCDETIDGRDSVKCMPANFEQDKCGWLICNNCLSCCSTEGLGRRVYAMEATSQEYKCHREGHRDLGIICCNKCGTPMDSNIFDEDEYSRVLNWFIDNKDNQIYIASSGKTQKGKWWFRFKKGRLSKEAYREKLVTLRRLTFHIPDFDDNEKTIQLITERRNAKYTQSELLICPNRECGNTIDLSSDIERATVIKKFHKTRFSRTESNFEG